MLTLRAPVKEFKALEGDGDQPGTFEAIIAVFDNIDLYGEVVEQGAFADQLKSDWPKLVWSHLWNQPPIGVTLEIREAPELGGVYAKGRLFVAEGEDSRLAREVWTALKAVDGNGDHGLDEFSYHYMPLDGGIEDRDGERVYVIRKAGMTEWGPCLKGVNPETTLLTVKSESNPDALVDPIEERTALLPGYDPTEITRAKSFKGNPEPNSTPDPEVDEEAKARTLKARELMFPPVDSV